MLVIGAREIILLLYLRGTNYPTGRVFDGYQISSLEQTEDEKVCLLRSRIIAMSNKSFLGRIVNGLSFSFFGMMNSFLRKETVGTNYDVVFASSGSYFHGALGSHFASATGSLLLWSSGICPMRSLLPQALRRIALEFA